jgi:pimeloyl-ACP methyl ester carboxylesterase
MKTMIRKTVKWLGILFGLLAIFVLLLRLEIIGNPILNMSFRSSDDKVMEGFANHPVTPTIGRIAFKEKNLRYLALEQDANRPYVVFIHGAPGSMTDYVDFFKDKELYTHYNLLSIDRPGYGYSEFGCSEPSISNQAEALMAVVKAICKHRNIVLVGHSYGGPIALNMLYQFPESFAHSMLLAPAIDPGNEKEIGIASLGVKPVSRWLVPPALRVAADEKTTHISELKKLEPLLAKINLPVCHIHGTKDSLVPYENVLFSQEHFNEDILEIITLENVDHFLPWSHHELIVEKLLQFRDGFLMNKNPQVEN